MGYPRCRGVAFRLDDVLLAGVAAAIVVALVGRGHSAEDARDVIKAKTIVARSLYLAGLKKHGTAFLFVPEDGNAALMFQSSRGWSLALGSDREGVQDIAYYRKEGLLGRGSSFKVDESGSPSIKVGDLNTPMNLMLSTAAGAPSLKMGRESMASIIVAGAGPIIPFPVILFIKAGTEEVHLAVDASDSLSTLSVLGENDGMKGQLRMSGAAGPELSLPHGKSSQAVKVGLDAMDRPFIRLQDQKAGTSRTLH